MVSKAVASMLLVGALAGGAIAGGYLLSRDPAAPTPKDIEELAGGDPESVPPHQPVPPKAAAAPVSRKLPVNAGATSPGSGGREGQAGQASLSPASPPPAPPLEFIEVKVPSGQLLDIQLAGALSSETAQVEDRVETRITKDVLVGAVVAIPNGSKLIGSVAEVDRGGRIKAPARLSVRLHTLKLNDMPDIPVVIDPLIQAGPEIAGDSKKKIGGGVAAGVGLGWLKGGLGGAVKGAVVGGGAGVATKVVEGRRAAEVPAGAAAKVELRSDIQIRVRR